MARALPDIVQDAKHISMLCRARANSDLTWPELMNMLETLALNQAELALHVDEVKKRLDKGAVKVQLGD